MTVRERGGERRRGVVIRLAPGEMWCRVCGNASSTSQAREEWARSGAECPRCGRRQWVEAESVLRPGEYYVAG